MSEPASAGSHGGAGSPARAGALLVASITLALVAWPIAFNLGAFDVVFYDDVFRFVVVAFVAMLVTFVAPPLRRRWVTRVVLASPALWLVLAVAVRDSVAEAATGPVFGAWLLAIVVVSVPVTLRLLVDQFVPGLDSVRRRSLTGWLVGVVVVVAVAGYLVGYHNDRFLTCEDFKVAGSDQPANCAPP